MSHPSDDDAKRAYQDAVAFLYHQLPMYQREGARALKVDLANIEALMDWLGHPHRAYKTIHLAGTNGKGSTAHFIAAGLHASGYKTALYTSPHYLDYRERIKIDGDYITEEAVVAFVAAYQEAALDVQPSFFELTVAMAFWYFRREEVDVAVIETGLGGRLDSTNVVRPDLSVITNISYDHMDTLGDTLSAIAGEKAGIIKSGVPVIIGRRQEAITDVFIEKARSLGSPLSYADEMVGSDDGLYRTLLASERWRDVPHAAENLRTAIAALSWLDRRLAYDIKMDLLEEALADIQRRWSYLGRWMILGQHPLVVADSAHNEEGVRMLMNHVDGLSKRHLHIIMGVVADKAIDRLWPYMPIDDVTYYYTQMSVPRTLPVADLASAGDTAGRTGRAYQDVGAAYTAALDNAGEEDLVLVIGSIFLVADLLHFMK